MKTKDLKYPARPLEIPEGIEKAIESELTGCDIDAIAMTGDDGVSILATRDIKKKRRLFYTKITRQGIEIDLDKNGSKIDEKEIYERQICSYRALESLISPSIVLASAGIIGAVALSVSDFINDTYHGSYMELPIGTGMRINLMDAAATGSLLAIGLPVLMGVYSIIASSLEMARFNKPEDLTRVWSFCDRSYELKGLNKKDAMTRTESMPMYATPAYKTPGIAGKRIETVGSEPCISATFPEDLRIKTYIMGGNAIVNYGRKGGLVTGTPVKVLD